MIVVQPSRSSRRRQRRRRPVALEVAIRNSASETLADALADAREADRQEIRGLVAIIQARLGDLEPARTEAEAIPEADSRVGALIAIAAGRLTLCGTKA